MKLLNELEIQETLQVGVLPTALASNLSVLFETNGIIHKRAVGSMINRNENEYLPSVSNAFPTSIFNFNASTTYSNPNLVVSLINQVAGTVFAAPVSLNGTPAFRKLVDSDLDQTTLGNKQVQLINGLHTILNTNKIDVKFEVGSFVQDKSNRDRLLFGNTQATDIVLKQATALGDFRIKDVNDNEIFFLNGSNKVPYFPQLPNPQTSDAYLAIFDSGNGLWKHATRIDDLSTKAYVHDYTALYYALKNGSNITNIQSWQQQLGIDNIIATLPNKANVNGSNIPQGMYWGTLRVLDSDRLAGIPYIDTHVNTTGPLNYFIAGTGNGEWHYADVSTMANALQPYFNVNWNLQQVTDNGNTHRKALTKGWNFTEGNTPNILRDLEGYTAGIARPIFATKGTTEEWGLHFYSATGNVQQYFFALADGTGTGIIFNRDGSTQFKNTLIDDRQFFNPNPFYFLNQNSGTAQLIATGGLLASFQYSDINLIPTNGIFSRGDIVSRSTVSAVRYIADADDSPYKGLDIRTNGTYRWLFTTDPNSENGSNTGSNLSLYRYDDGGNYAGNIFTVFRNNGLINFADNITTNNHYGSAEWKNAYDIATTLQNTIGNYVQKTGDLITGQISIFSANGSPLRIRGNAPTQNYTEYQKYNGSVDIGYVGADGGAAFGGGVGDNFGIRAINDLLLHSGSNRVRSVASELWSERGFTVDQTVGAGYGISLYQSTSANPDYGIMFATSANYGSIGVTSDWNTYFTMQGGLGRGWIFRHKAIGNVLGISGEGRVFTLYDLSSQDWAYSYRNALMNRGTIYTSNITFNNLPNVTEINSIQTGNGTGNSGFPQTNYENVNQAYGTHNRLSANSFITDIIGTHAGAMYHKTWYLPNGADNQPWRRLWDDIDLPASAINTIVNFNPNNYVNRTQNINEEVNGVKQFSGNYLGIILNGDGNTNAWGYLESTSTAFNIGVQVTGKPISFYVLGAHIAKMSQAGLEVYNNIITSNYGSASDWWGIATNGFRHNYQGGLTNASNGLTNQSWFDYNPMGMGSAYNGIIASFDGLNSGYRLELHGRYDGGGNVFFIRTMNGDTQTWNPTREIVTDYNITSYVNSIIGSTYALANGTNLTNISGWQTTLDIGTWNQYDGANLISNPIYGLLFNGTTNKWQPSGNVAFKNWLDLSAYALTSNIPTVNNGTLSMSVGTGLSGSATFTANQAGASSFVVTVASGYVLPTTTQWNSKQNTLIAGTNITIDPVTNVISASGGGGGGGIVNISTDNSQMPGPTSSQVPIYFASHESYGRPEAVVLDDEVGNAVMQVTSADYIRYYASFDSTFFDTPPLGSIYDIDIDGIKRHIYNIIFQNQGGGGTGGTVRFGDGIYEGDQINITVPRGQQINVQYMNGTIISSFGTEVQTHANLIWNSKEKTWFLIGYD